MTPLCCTPSCATYSIGPVCKRSLSRVRSVLSGVASIAVEKEGSHHPLPARIRPRGSNSLVALRIRRRSLLDIVGRGQLCRVFDFGVGVEYPAVEWRAQRTAYDIGLPPFPIPSVGENRGTPLEAGPAHRKIRSIARARRLSSFCVHVT